MVHAVHSFRRNGNHQQTVALRRPGGLSPLRGGILRRFGTERRKGLPFIQMNFLLLAAFCQHRYGIAEQVGPQDLHGALIRLIAFAQTGTMAMEIVVIFLLIGQAAEQATADPGNFCGVQKKVLFLGHTDSHRGELAQVAAAAADHAAVAHGPHHLGFVAHADLAQLNTRPVFAHQILDQVAEVNAGGRGEVKNQLAAVKKNFHIYQLHIHAAFTDTAAAKGRGFSGQTVILLPLADIFRAGLTQNLRQIFVAPPFRQFCRAGNHAAQS